MEANPSLRVAVLIERQCQPNQWEAWRFRLDDVVVDEGGFGDTARVLRDDGKTLLQLHPGFEVTLYRDEAEGYYLNLSSGAPAWFVMWRVDDADPSKAWPELVTLSYNEAGRLLDAQERVDNVPLSGELIAWLHAYTEQHYRPEPKKRSRAPSFRAPSERQ
jgi:hypothetical protein